MSPSREAGGPPAALTVAGSDSGGGAGIQADLEAFAALGVHGLSAITALTAQSSVEVRGVFEVPASFVRLQMETVAADFHIAAAKTGMLASPEVIAAVADGLEALACAVVVDPVMVASSGARLVPEAAVAALLERLFPRAAVLTPNLPEVAALLGHEPRSPSEMAAAGARLLERGPAAVLVKGGHLSGDPVDVLVRRDGPPISLGGARIRTTAGHGTGCTYAAAIAALLARGESVEDAVRGAHAFLREALSHAPEGLGRGAGPLHPVAALRRGVAPR